MLACPSPNEDRMCANCCSNSCLSLALFSKSLLKFFTSFNWIPNSTFRFEASCKISRFSVSKAVTVVRLHQHQEEQAEGDDEEEQVHEQQQWSGKHKKKKQQHSEQIAEDPQRCHQAMPPSDTTNNKNNKNNPTLLPISAGLCRHL